jgi:hypothetical protein
MKKIVSLSVAISIVFTLPLCANIDEQIKAIRNAPIEKRFELMNAFKKELILMKETERIQALKKLTVHSKKQDANKVLEALKKHTAQQKARQQLEIQYIDIDNIQNETQDQNGGDEDDDS